jgi:hypothetical protein
VGQTLVILVLGSVVYAIIESRWLGWTSPIILSLLGVGIGVLGLLSTGRWALDTARRAATLFEEVDRGADLRTAPSARTT